jgi:tRNA-dihydrouridine synthase A
MQRKISIAPMMDYTDRHFRTLLRMLSRHVLLYTEMITANALLHGDKEYLLGFDAFEHPVALQLGGSCPKAMAACAKIAEDFNYDEVNINAGCPSDRVQAGRFGACLMKEPNTVADMVAAMQAATRLPVTVKCRLGVDDRESYDLLCQFVDTVAAAGCQSFMIHARKAWLKGLSPKENRTIPPLKYDWVYQLKQDFPQLEIIINGGIQSLDEVAEHLSHVDGCMLGRVAYQNTYELAGIDKCFFNGTDAVPTRLEILERYCDYMQRQWEAGVPLSAMLRHVLGLWQGVPGARGWRRSLTEFSQQANELSSSVNLYQTILGEQHAARHV